MDFLLKVSTYPDNFQSLMIVIISGPCGVVALIIILVGLPSNFPYQKTSKSHISWQSSLNMRNFRRVDLLGLFLLLGASTLFVTSLEEGGTHYSWKSEVTLTLLMFSFALFVLFMVWERYQDKRETAQEPIFPWRLAKNRFAMGIFR
jgi:MFS family permease